jgi:hypothetical protein
MTDQAAISYRVRTAHGTVHSMTDGRVYRLRGGMYRNRSSSPIGKADCGALTSGAAAVTIADVTCRICSAGH